MTERERRSHYRLRYPREHRPVVKIDGAPRPLCELSARGLRFRGSIGELEPGGLCQVSLAVTAHPTIEVDEAVVLRFEGGEYVVWLPIEIDCAVVMREQRRLIRRARRQSDPAAMNALRTWPPVGDRDPST